MEIVRHSKNTTKVNTKELIKVMVEPVIVPTTEMDHKQPIGATNHLP